MSTNIRDIKMPIPKITNRIFTNRAVLKGLEKVSEHAISFSATTALFMSTVVRSYAIHKTPNVEKENKQYAMSNSIASGLIKFGIVESVALPVEYMVKKIDDNPQKYLKESTIKNLQNSADELVKSRSYKLITQVVKLGTGVITAVPKTVMTIALIPVIMDKMFKYKTKADKSEKTSSQLSTPMFGKNVKFTGLTNGIAKVIDNPRIQKWANKYQYKDKDIAKHVTAGTDILLTSSFAYLTNKSDKIKENRKKALIYNNIISTAITLGLGYWFDNLIKCKTDKFIDKFKKLNLNDPKVLKYVEGINIIRPALIFAGIYYGILPMFSTFMAQKIDNYIKKHQ
ncbi:MAG: hypothetical protein NC191_07135 [Muribaculaceae bacterium]|nr:hypothetical protein [Muribaculaceae bacterium]